MGYLLMIDFNKIEKYKENNRIEAKKALGGLPHSIWETYSAFANTLGGIILLGVEEYRDKSFHPVDLPDPEGLISEFWNIVNNTARVSANILSPNDVTVEEIDGKSIVAIRVPRARRGDMPVYIEGNPFLGSYRRNGEGDYKCTKDEVEKMMAAADKAYHADGNTAATAVARKKAVISYLTENITARFEDVCELLSLEPSITRELLLEMVMAEIVIAEGDGDQSVYKLKS